MFAKKVYQWNAVDVVRSNGELDRGLVVDKQKSHLLVDFDITGKQPELVPCENASLSSKRPSRSFDSTDDVVILKQLSQNQPWKWHPAKVLIRPRDGNASFALVKIRIGDEGVMDCVRVDCIRMSDYIGSPIRKNDFVKEECSVPDGFSYDAQSIAPWRERFPRTQPIGIVNSTFHFLRLCDDKHLDVEKMASALSDGIPKGDEMETTEDNRGVKRRHEEISCLTLERCETVALVDVKPINHPTNSNEEAETTCVIDSLPVDILGVVFSFLDGRQQTRLRPVSSAWNFKILSPDCSRGMILDLNLYENNHEYILGSWLVHCITKWTKSVTITWSGIDPAVSCYFYGRAMRFLKEIMKCKRPLSAVVLNNIHLEPKHILTESRTAINLDMQTVCSRLIVKDVTIFYLLYPEEDHLATHLAQTNSSEKDLRIAFGSVKVNSQNELLDCFEGAVADFTDPKHRRALERVSRVIAQLSDADMDRRSQIINVLKDWQKNDIRFGPNTEWKHVQLAQLGANLLTLRNTTLSILVCLTKKWRPRVLMMGDDDSEDEFVYSDFDF